MLVTLVALLLTAVATAPLAAAGENATLGTIADTGSDPDGDGLFESLDLSVEVVVSVPGWFYASAAVYPLNSPLLITSCWSGWVELISTTTVSLSCSGVDIARSHVDGPYSVMVSLFAEGQVSQGYAYYTTGPYSASQFEAPPVTLVPPYVEYGLDLNGNGLFDVIRTDITMDVGSAGVYEVDLYIEDTTSTYTDLVWVQDVFDIGRQTVTLDVSGWRISALGISGPYGVQISVIDSASDLVAQDTFVTAAYDASAFDPAPAVLSPPYSDRGLDTDGDGAFNFLAFDIPVWVNQGGDYYLSLGVMDPLTGLAMSGTDFEFLPGPGLTLVHIEVSTVPMAAQGVDGPYGLWLELDMFDAVGNQLIIDEDEAVTGAYASSVFDPPPARLAASPTDRGVDRDGDGLYDVLEAAVAVDVFEAGLYVVYGYLGGSPGPSANDVRYAYLEPGVGTIPLEFSGVAISRAAVDGPYPLRFGLRVAGHGQVADIESASTVTSAYRASEFEARAATTLAGRVTDAPTNEGLLLVQVTAYDYEHDKSVARWTDASGAYSLALYEGDWVVVFRDLIYYTHAEALERVHVAAPATTLDAALGPLEPHRSTTDLNLSSWDAATRTQSWTFDLYRATVRQRDDWWYGDRDQYLTRAEFENTRIYPSSYPPPLPAWSGSLFRIDGAALALVPGSDVSTYADVEGAIDDASPMHGRQDGSYTATSSATPAATHTVEVTVRWALPVYVWDYTVELPAGYVAAQVYVPSGITVAGFGTGAVTLSPGRDPDPTDGIDSAQITIVAVHADAPTIADVRAEPNPADRGETMALSAVVLDTLGIAQVVVEIRDPRGRSLGMFPMTLNPATGRYEYAQAFKTRGTYTFMILATDAAGLTSTASGSFVVQKVSRNTVALSGASGIL